MWVALVYGGIEKQITKDKIFTIYHLMYHLQQEMLTIPDSSCNVSSFPLFEQLEVSNDLLTTLDCGGTNLIQHNQLLIIGFRELCRVLGVFY